MRTEMRQRPHAASTLILGIAFLVSSCGGASSPSSPVPNSVGTASQTTSVSPSVSPSLAVVPPSPSGPTWTYVAFGDSWPFGAHCDGCRPFPVLYAEGLSATTGHRIDFINLVTNGGTAKSLLADIKSSQSIRDAITRADIIAIATGGNDLEPAFNASVAGTCGGADDLDCYRTVTGSLRSSFEGIVNEIDSLRAGRPTAVRLVTGSNEYLADPGLIDMLGKDFGRTEGVAITKMLREMFCSVAAVHHAECVDLAPLLNGPDFLVPHDVNTQEAMQTVADAILAVGLDELQ